MGPVSLGVIDQFDIRTFSCNGTAGRGYAALFVVFFKFKIQDDLMLMAAILVCG